MYKATYIPGTPERFISPREDKSDIQIEPGLVNIVPCIQTLDSDDIYEVGFYSDSLEKLRLFWQGFIFGKQCNTKELVCVN